MSDLFTPKWERVLLTDATYLFEIMLVRRNWKCMKQITPIDPFFLDLTDD